MTFRKPSRTFNLRSLGSDDDRRAGRRPSRRRESTKGIRRDEKRRSLMENLENRQLLAGPDLIGVQPNEGDLLDQGDVLRFSPNELVFRFDDNTQIDPDTLSAIRLTRAGEDGNFESARATSDLGTNGQALFEFRARQAGGFGNGIQIVLESEFRLGTSSPVITTEDRVVTISLNSNPALLTRAGDLVSSVNNNADASELIEAIQVSGSSLQQLGLASVDGTTLTLAGANAAQAVTDFGTNGAVRVRMISQTPGLAGRDTQVLIESRNFGGSANPVVVVTDQTIRVQLNSFVGDPSTADDFINAINSNPQASALIAATVQEGSGATVIGNLSNGALPPITLSGVSDVAIEPGFVGLGDSSREVVFRFAEPLPDDLYQIDIIGAGAFALRDADGEAFQDGVDLTQTFSINLGPKVVAVVPEPVRRNADGSLSPDTGKIDVHFNDDDLNMADATNPDFYQLIYTRDTIDNGTDAVVRPISVTYSTITNIATLNFGRPLSRMIDPLDSTKQLEGSARLRVGTTEDLPQGPTSVTLPTNSTLAPDGAGDSFDNAYDLNQQWDIDGATTTQSATLTTEIRNETRFGLDLPGPDVQGTRDIRPDDPTRLDRVVPLDYVRGDADQVNGISVIEYDFVASWLGDDPNRPGITDDYTYFSIISEQQRQRVREVMTLYSEYLGVSFIEVDDRDPSEVGGFSIAVGDLYGGDEREASAQGGLAVVTRDRDADGVDDLVVMDFQDFDESTDDQFGGEFFRGAMFGVGQLLGYGYADDLPQPVTQSTDFIFQPGTDNEPAFPSYADITHGQYLYRPDSTDVDLYRFQLDQRGSIAIETIAERLNDASLLDTQLRLYQQLGDDFVEIAQNDDYFSNDSLIRLNNADPGVYMIGVSAKGNDSYDPAIPGSGFGGLSEGDYELRVDFSPAAISQMSDTTGVPLDGDVDGQPGGTFDYWFKISDFSETLFVDKGDVTLNIPTGQISPSLGDVDFVEAFRNRTIGLTNNPYSEIDQAITDASRMSQLKQQAANGTFVELNQLTNSGNPQDVLRAESIRSYLDGLDLSVRVLGNGGLDGLEETLQDNFSYNVGFTNNGLPLPDGSSLNLPADVQLMIDSGAIIKFSRARIGVGSVAPTIDVSASNLQVLGTPGIINSVGQFARDSAGAIIPGSVFLTSVNDDSLGTGNQIGITPNPRPGDWGGIDFRGDLDSADELRPNLEDAGVFRNHLQFTDIRYGGGVVSVGGQDLVISPVEMAITRPTVINSQISQSANAAMAGTPDTFREDRFTSPRYQQQGAFTPDYERVGPEIHGNVLDQNSVNGLFIRLSTRSGEDLEQVTTATRFDDSDIPHVLTENLVIAGTPGGPIAQAGAPSSFLIRASESIGDGAVPAGTYAYRITNVSDNGLESAASDPTTFVTTTATGGIRLNQLPTPEPGSETISRRLYRATVDGSGQPGLFTLVAQLNASSTNYTDRVAVGGTPLPESASPLRSRLDASLVIDPGTVLKIDGARIEARFGANFVAEGLPGNPVVITSLEDQRYGGGGTFDTNDRGDTAQLNPGDWGGIYIGNGSSASIDNAVIAGGGGNTRIEGGFASFNTIEVHQANLRLTNSRIEFSADGRGALNGTRVGRNDNAEGAVFARASTPIIVDNDFIDNATSALSFDVNSLNATEVFDWGRSTGHLGKFDVIGNSGPLIEDNTLTRNEINGLFVRGGQLVTEGVWDDVDMVHVVTDSIEIPNKHIFGGLRLISDARGSLVVKFESADETEPAGIVVGGSLLTAADEFRDIPGRIGGSLQLIGHPDFPVVLTSLQDDLVGAGFTIDGRAQLDTNRENIFNNGSDDSGSGQAGTLPVGPEVNLGNTIDNDVDQSIPGHFGATIGDGGDVQFGGSTATVEDAQTGNILVAQNFVFQYSTYLVTGTTGTLLSQSTITQTATLIADDVVESRGTYAGPNGAVDWVATSSFQDGVSTLFSRLELSSSQALGDIRVVSYLDEDVFNVSDDVMYTIGTPGESDFRIFTIDSALRVGFSHGGFYAVDGLNQNNASYEGWAADQYNELEAAIIAGTQTYSIAGDIDLADLPQNPDPIFGTVWGPNDITTAHSWVLDDTASNATVTNFLELLAQDPVIEPPTAQIVSGNWNGIVIREGADDRNVAAVAEQEPVRTTVFDTNAIPSQSQFLGEIAPDEQSGDENRRLGFIVDGAITTRDDVDVYSFIAESNTEVWLDIDRTSHSLDTVIELIDFNGQVLAASNDSLLAETDPDGIFISSRLDDDAAQPLTVNEERFQVQQINIDGDIRNATSGDVTLGISTLPGQTTTIPYVDFLADPAGSVEAALEAAYPDELGDVTAQVLRTVSDDFVIELIFDEIFFAGREIPGVQASVVSIVPTIPAASVEYVTRDSALQDEFSSNAKDAGMRIRLPGETGTRNLYHIRVRSSNTQDPTDFATLIEGDVLGGLTRGRYSMQVRLGEADESPGTQIKLTDVRYATNGVQVIGQPLHSPLLGEEAETSADNDSATNAQRLGYFGVNGDQAVEAGPLQSDRLAKSIAGSIDSATDVDWYEFEINYENLTRDGDPLLLSTIFDLDYASNFARSDMALYVFDATGALIYTGTDSNIAEDLPASDTTNSTEDLSRGGAGKEDPFIGSVELREGTYYLAVANQTQVPLPLDQFFNAASANPLVRLQPIDAIDRVAEDNMTSRVLFDDQSITPYSLDDVILYVNTTNGLSAVNPFTGENYGIVGTFGSDAGPNDDIYDIAFRSNGELQAYTGFSRSGNRGDNNFHYVQIDTGNADTTTVRSGAGIITYGSITIEDPGPQVLESVSNEGFFIEAITIRELQNREQGFFVGSRDAFSIGAGAQYRSNVLYDFDPATGTVQDDSFTNRFLASSGAGTTPREVGQIDVTASAADRSTQLGVTGVLEIGSAGTLVQMIQDGDVFTIVGGTAPPVTFEFDVESTIAMTGAAAQDGETFTVGTAVFEFDTGSGMNVEPVTANGGLAAGQSVTVTDTDGVSHTFEFINQGEFPTPGNVPVTIRLFNGQALSSEQIATDLGAAIEAEFAENGEPTLTATVVGTEIRLSAGTTFVVDGTGITQVGNVGVTPGNLVIPVESNAGPSEILEAIDTSLTDAGVNVVVDGLTFTIPGATSISINSGAIAGGGTSGVEVLGRTPIPVALSDSADDVAVKVAQAINGLNGDATAVADNHSVRIVGGFVTGVSNNLVAGGVPTGGVDQVVSAGGQISGMEIVGNDIYALTENGGLYVVPSNQLINAGGTIHGSRRIGNYIDTATDLVRIADQGVQFTGLRAGPNSVDGGIYSDVLFGLTNNGDIYAFNLRGELMPFFAGGASSISTGIGNAEGLDFSTLDYSLWHYTTRRSGDAGHGGGTSLAFSYDTSFNSNYDSFTEYPSATARRDQQGVTDTYNLPGGAKGEVVSNTFSLEGYSPSDAPTLYFNYLIDADGGGSTDALRVYLVQPDGTQHAVALNTTARNPSFADDEFDDPPVAAPYNDTIDTDKQQLFDNTATWRQARVPLDEFAGQGDLRLRVEFSTAGSFDTSSSVIYTVAGEDLAEGQELVINRETFTVDFPPTLISPSGYEVAEAYAADAAARAVFQLDGLTYVLNDGTRVVDTSPQDPLDPDSLPNEVSIDLTAILATGETVADLSSEEIAEAIVNSTNALPPDSTITYDIVSDNNSIEFGSAATLSTVSPTLFAVRNVDDVGANPIPVRAAMTADEVAAAVQTVLSEYFVGAAPAAGQPAYFPTSSASVKVPGYNVNSYGPFANASQRYEEQFGSTPVQGSRDNDFEGVFLDDFIIGLAERGEQVTDQRAAGIGIDTTFVSDQRYATPQPDDPQSDLVTGSYQVEIRDGSEYVASGLSTDTSLSQFRSFDSNTRLSDAISIVAKGASTLRDGQMFSITDGRATVEFEFDLDGTVTPGRVRVPISLEVTDADNGLLRPQTATEVADAVIDAINRSDVRSVLDVRAVPSSGFENEVVAQEGIKTIDRVDPRINLIGDVVISDPTSSFESVERSDLRGDSNRERDAQGVILIENSRFLFNENYGLEISHDVSADVGGTATDSIVRYPRNLVELNTEDIIPGVVVQSNVFAFNTVGGIRVQGIDGALGETTDDPISIERIVNNTIIGGLVVGGTTAPSETFEGVLFPSGRISFADAVVDYTPGVDDGAPGLIHQTPMSALGAPDCFGRGPEPADGSLSVSLGLGGSITLQFTDNFLTGSDDSLPDLVVFESGEIESVQVEISRDGIAFFDVGIVGGISNFVDIDAYGYTSSDRFAFVRLTDLRQGTGGVASLGADIDAVGAISSVSVDQFIPGGIGIDIVGDASPTMLNNIISNSETGLSVTGDNGGYVSGGNAYYKNTMDVSDGLDLGTLPLELTDAEAVFVDPGAFVFSPAAGSRIIDSSIDSLPDRASLTTVRNAIGIAPSPTLAPRLDVNGQLRVDDPNVEPPNGLGENIFKDRGGFDRGDLTGPRVTLLSPLAPGIGLDAGRATVLGSAPQAFEIQLIDGIPPADIVPGTGVDDRSVSSESLVLFRDGVPQVEGIDYRYAYNPSTNIIRLTPIAGVWRDNSTYVIRMVDSQDAIIRAADGNVYVDGDQLSVIDQLGQPTVFEYEVGITVEFSTSLTADAADGITVSIFDGSVTREFELDNNDASTLIPVEIPEFGNAADFAEALADAINNDPFLNMTARFSEGTVQLLGGTPLANVTTNNSFVAVRGEIGTETGFGFEIPNEGNTTTANVDDGQTFIVRLGAINEVIFEFDNDGFINTDGALGISISDVSTLDQIANEIVRVVGGSGLGLAPENRGFGRVFLGGDANYSIDLTGSTLEQISLPGRDATVPIEIPIDQPAEEIVEIVRQAIDDQNLPGIETSIVDVRVFLDGTGGVSGVGAVETIVVQDQVGNQLQNNQADGRTELTIFVGRGFDYGDAPAPYTSTLAEGGPRHALDPNLVLGSAVNADSDAQLPNADANDDGIAMPGVFQSGFAANLGIYFQNLDEGQATDNPVYLDAWFDWDQDGEFEAQELYRFGTAGTNRTPIFSNTTTNVLINVPASAFAGETFARFRLSETPNLGPIGEASVGEVEDYRIFVSNNPFQNPSNRFDVNDSGSVTPLDALQVINALARSGESSIDLQVNPIFNPEYPDVSGNGILSPFDALQVINELGRQQSGASGEGEAIAGSYVQASPGVLVSGPTAIGDQLISQASIGVLPTSESGDEESDPEQNPVSSVEVSTEKTSVFDSPESMELDSIVEELAADTASVNDDDDDSASILDAVFSEL